MGLGWFSIGLGLTQLLFPRRFARAIGVRHDRGWTPLVGVREVAAGVGILSQPRPAGWLWARVGGDLMDLALLWAALGARRARTDRIAMAMAAVAGVLVLDIVAAQRLSRGPPAAAVAARGAVRVRQAVAINRPVEQLYRYWHGFERLPRFMRHVESVSTVGEKRTHWVARGPAGMRIEWDSEITEDRPNQLIAWRSLPGADLPNTGSVRFMRAPGGRGAIVSVDMEYRLPGGRLGAGLARLLGQEPGQQARESLRRFKQLMETGEILQSDATAKGWGAARPPRANQVVGRAREPVTGAVS